MEYRQLGRSGLKVSSLTLGTMTMGGKGKFANVGTVGLDEARRQIDMCLDAGVNLIDTADVYSNGASEEIVGEALGGKRKSGVLIATKARFPMGDGPNDRGLSRHHLIEACEASLRRLKTDVIDLYQVHEWDGVTPLEETLEALDLLVRQGKVRYVGCSNYSGWHLMKALGVSARDRLPAFVSQQIHYTLEAREAEYELVPISLDQGLGILVWSPLAGACCRANIVATSRRKARVSWQAGKSRPFAIRNGCGPLSTLWSTLRARAAFRRHRSRSRGCWGVPRWRPSSSVDATKRNCATTWARPISSSPRKSASDSTRSASPRCSTRTGTRCKRQAIAWAPQTFR